MTEESKKAPAKLWHVNDEAAVKLIPKDGFIHDFVDYGQKCTHAPLWYQLGACLTMMTTALAGRELRITHADGRQGHVPLSLWSAIVGISGDCKNAGMRPAVRILHRAKPRAILATDFSTEALHDGLAHPEVGGIGLMYKGELSHLFAQGRRSYSSTLEEWMLSAYDGDPLSRDTKKGGFVLLSRPRLSVLGGIPPDILQQKTTRADWRSGYMPRFLFWGAQRTRYQQHEIREEELEADFAKWIQVVCMGSDDPIIAPPKTTEVITDWVYEMVEKKRWEFPTDVFSALVRLQEKAFRIAACVAASQLDHIPTGSIRIKPRDARIALEIIEAHRLTLIHLFSAVSANADMAEESSVLATIIERRGATLEELVDDCGMSRYKIRRVLEGYLADDVLYIETTLSDYGRKERKYHLQ